DLSLRGPKGWLAENPAGAPINKGAQCTVCQSALRAHHADLLKHAENSKHKANMEKYNTLKQSRLETAWCVRQTLIITGIEFAGSEKKAIDLKLAVYIACHSAVRSMDHLCDILKIVGKGSKLEHLQLHRTKCSNLISKVIAPAMLTELVEDVGASGFSLIIDNSTDVSVIKFIALVIRFYSVTDCKIKTEFLGFAEVYRATAAALYDLIKGFLDSVGLNYWNIIGLGTDGASNLCGRNNSVYTLFKAEIPNILLVRCVCHSLHVAASKAAMNMPAELEFLVRETRNWFARSPLRKLQYRDLYSAINNGKMPPALVQLVKTRWLAWAKAIDVVLAQWVELRQHFINHCEIEKNDPSENPPPPRCRSYLATLTLGVLDLLPDHAERLCAIRMLHPDHALRLPRPNFLTLPLHLAQSGADVDDLKTEWDQLDLTDWKLYFGGSIPTHTFTFWEGVAKYEQPGGGRAYSSISDFALRVLSLPHSNAVVERAFSVMNSIKVKARSRMGAELLVAIMRIGMRLAGRGCCAGFRPSADMFRRFTADMYEALPRERPGEENTADDGEDGEDDEALHLLGFDADDLWEDA
ncbi:Zinc finger protein 862, partial [Frankliniella fusca]